MGYVWEERRRVAIRLDDEGGSRTWSAPARHVNMRRSSGQPIDLDTPVARRTFQQLVVSSTPAGSSGHLSIR
jgi:hypothetical protein